MSDVCVHVVMVVVRSFFCSVFDEYGMWCGVAMYM